MIATLPAVLAGQAAILAAENISARLEEHGRTRIRWSSLLLYQGRERQADAVQHRRVLSPHALALGCLKAGRVQLPVVQDLDLLLTGKGGMVDHCVGNLEEVGRVVQSPFQIDLTHLDLRTAAAAGRGHRIEQVCPPTETDMVNRSLNAIGEQAASMGRPPGV